MVHLLLYCPLANELWRLWFGVYWVMPWRVLDMLAYWQGWFDHRHNIAIWKVVPHCLIWCKWWEWNARSFEWCERTTLDLKLLLFKSLFYWTLALGSFSF